MPVPSSMSDLSTTAASNSPAGSDSPTSGDDYLRSIQAIIRTTNAKGADIASAATTDIGAATGEFVDVTGTTTITALGTVAAGIVRTVRFTGALTLTHNATSLILPGAANITTAANDVAQFRSLGSGNWLCVGYVKAAGYAKAGANSDITSLTACTNITAAAVTVAADDKVVIQDTSDSDKLKTVTTQAIANLATNDKIQPITASVGSNALTLTLNATALDFRSSTLGSGTVNTRTVASPISLVISSGSTLGTTSGIQSRIAVLAIDNAGTVELAAVNVAGGTNLDETGLITTIAEGGAGAADSISTIYSTTARSNVPYRVVGFVESTQATAGTWATAPSTIQGAGGQSLKRVNAICNSVAVASTSGTSIDFTGIPSWVKRITVMFNGVSTSGTSNPIVQLGDSGGIENTGYTSTAMSGTASQTSTAGLVVSGSAGTDVRSGNIYITNQTGNDWTNTGTVTVSTGAVWSCAGSKSLSGTLDRIRITTANGTDTFDAGSVNILWE